MAVKPRALSKGDTVGIVAPSEPITKQEQFSVERFFVKAGYKVKFGANILAARGDYAAGTAKQRAEDINAMFADSEVRAIFPAVGGLVASQVLPFLDFEMVCKNPKIFTGYSDATTLKVAMLAKCGLVTFHTPNAVFLPGRKIGGYTLSNLWKILTNNSDKVVIEPQSVWREICPGEAEGVLFGGNLSCICKLLGTPYDPLAALERVFGAQTRYIFFWEEAYDQFSEIMRNFWQIKNTGFLAKVSGMLVGKLAAVKEVDYQNFPTKRELLLEATEEYRFPILYGVDFGHEVPQATVPVGVRAAMETKKFRLEILEPAVV
jgi:muramoyltetrapeptide carboxypeptidase